MNSSDEIRVIAGAGLIGIAVAGILAYNMGKLDGLSAPPVPPVPQLSITFPPLPAPIIHNTMQGCPIWVPGKRHKPTCAQPAAPALSDMWFVPASIPRVVTRSEVDPPVYAQPDVQPTPAYVPPVQANIPVYVEVHVDHMAIPGTWPAGHRCYHETTAPCDE
jgi:hypothetical protein